MTREAILKQLGSKAKPWDVVVVGGGATGLGAAVEAACRGYRTLLIERFDFAKGTSSRSTKLAHGGVRYLQQLNVALVLDALHERGHMLRNAPHLVHDLSFVVPAYSFGALPYYGLGLKLYEELSGRLSLGKSEWLSRAETLEKLPGINAYGLRGGILYHDGQFDDARYAIALLRTLQDAGGVGINYVEATGLIQRGGKTIGVRAQEREEGVDLVFPAKVVVNATGVHAEEMLAFDGRPSGSLLMVSQGTHFVLPRSFLPGNAALMVPKTADGRVLFAIPWHGATLVGTTEEQVDRATVEPRSMRAEREFLREHIERYLQRAPAPAEILSVWSGLRPLVRKRGTSSARLPRNHTILVSASGLVTVTGGKWTTYRRMGQDTIDRAAQIGGLPERKSRTLEMKLHGWTQDAPVDSEGGCGEWERVYGSDLPQLQELSAEEPGLEGLIHPRLPFRRREVIWAARHEMARTVEDVLARRTRALFLDARAAMEVAPEVARLLAEELYRSDTWMQKDLRDFLELAEGYLVVD